MLSLEKQNQWRDVYRAKHPEWRPATEVFAGRVRDHSKPESRLLDVGCGRGGLFEQLNHPLARATGIDPDFSSLREHRVKHLPRAAALSDHLPFAGNTFDVVMASWLLEHLANPERTFKAIAQVLRHNGVFVFITPNARHPLTIANRVAGRLGHLQGRLVNRIYGRATDDTFATFYQANTPQKLTFLALGAGLLVESIDLIADPTYVAFHSSLFRGMSLIDDYLPDDRRIHLVGVLRKPSAGTL
jgi:2-polyprenyl-3-methyl-5-hydroxy-6-metoxy-1,4-benzoquinol methylase